jgi:hypothetical protein
MYRLIYMNAIHVAERGNVMATLRLRFDQLTKLRRLAGLESNTALAHRMNFDAGNLSRVLAGKQQPGPKFMAALVSAFPGFSLDDLFEVVSDTEEAAA